MHREAGERHNEKLELKDHYENEVTKLAEKLAKLREQTAQAIVDVDRENHAKNQLRMQVNKKQATIRHFNDQIKEMKRELIENALATKEANKEGDGVEAQLEKSNALGESLERERKRAKEANDRAVHSAAVAKSEARTVEDDYDLFLAKTAAEMHDLEDQVKNLESEPAELEAALRKAFKEQLERISEERKKQLEEDNNEGMSELERRYAQKWREYNRQLDDIHASNDDLKDKLDHLKSQITAAKRHTEPSERLAAAIKHANQLQDDITRANDRWSRAAARNKVKLEGLRATRNKKDREYDDLMDLKVALAMEIKAYEDLLHIEEERLKKYNSPARRRRDQVLKALRDGQDMETDE